MESNGDCIITSVVLDDSSDQLPLVLYKLTKNQGISLHV